VVIGRGAVCGGVAAGAGLGQVGPPECVAMLPYSSDHEEDFSGCNA
jgi:hypothetical protein